MKVINHSSCYKKMLFELRSWCQTCNVLIRPLCIQEKHKITDFITKDVEEHDTLVVQVESGAQEALDKRNKGEEPLLIERDHLQAKLDVVKAQIEENRVYKEKLMQVISECHRMKQMPSEKKVSAFIQKHLKKKLDEVKVEVNLANKFLQQRTPQAVRRLKVFPLNLYILDALQKP